MSAGGSTIPNLPCPRFVRFLDPTRPGCFFWFDTEKMEAAEFDDHEVPENVKIPTSMENGILANQELTVNNNCTNTKKIKKEKSKKPPVEQNTGHRFNQIQEVSEPLVVTSQNATNRHLRTNMPLPWTPEYLQTFIETAAHKQCDQPYGSTSNTAYQQGLENFNIWYGKYYGDGLPYKDKERPIASTKLDVYRDSGTTIGYFKWKSNNEFPYLCLWFARGACCHGHECNYIHRVPVESDELLVPSTKDIFGRDRHAAHRWGFLVF
jgi:hypothetical protein